MTTTRTFVSGLLMLMLAQAAGAQTGAVPLHHWRRRSGGTARGDLRRIRGVERRGTGSIRGADDAGQLPRRRGHSATGWRHRVRG